MAGPRRCSFVVKSSATRPLAGAGPPKREAMSVATNAVAVSSVLAHPVVLWFLWECCLGGCGVCSGSLISGFVVGCRMRLRGCELWN